MLLPTLTWLQDCSTGTTRDHKSSQGPEDSPEAARDYFKTTDWEVLCEANGEDIDCLTCGTVLHQSDYINFCVENILRLWRGLSLPVYVIWWDQVWLNCSSPTSHAYLRLRSLSQPERTGCTVRILFFDFSSAFNTRQSSLLSDKMDQADLDQSLLSWTMDYLTNRPQNVLHGCV